MRPRRPARRRDVGAVRSRRARGRSIATPRAFASTRGTGRAGSGARRGGRAFPAPPRGAFRTTIDERAARTGGAAAGACAPRLERSSPITMCVRSWAGRSMRAIRCSRASKCVSADEGNNTRGKLSSSGRREAWTNELGRRPAAESQHSGRPAGAVAPYLRNFSSNILIHQHLRNAARLWSLSLLARVSHPSQYRV